MLPPVIAELLANTKEFTAKMGEAKAQMAETADSGGKSVSKLNGLGKGLAMGLGAAVVGVGALALDLGEKFQTSTASLAGHAGIAIGAANNIGKAFLNTAGTTTFSASEMMGAISPIAGEIENLTGHTLTSSDAMKVLKGSMDLAEASGEPLATVTKSLVDIMLPFHMSLTDSGTAANVLWNTQRALGVSTSDLSSTYQRLVPRVAGSGMSLQQMSGFVVELSHSLGGGRQALRTAGTAIQGLISPSSTANKALAAMGIQLFDSKGKFIGMGPAIEKMKSGLATLPGAAGGVAATQKILALTTEQATLKGEAQTKSVKAQESAIAGQLPALKLQANAFTQSSAMQAIFGKQANGMLAVIAGGAATFNKYTAQVGKSGQVQSAAALNAATMHGEMKKMEATATDLVTTIGVKLVPVVTSLIGAVSSATNFLMHHKDVLIALAGIIGTVVVAAIGSFIASQIAATIETITNFATMAAGAVTWLATTVASFATAIASGAVWVATNGAQAAVTAATWLASNAATLASFIATNVARLAVWIAGNAVIVAGAVATGIAAAAAFLLPLAPFILIGAAAALLVYEIVKHFTAIKNFIVGVVGDVISWIKSHWELILAILTGPVGLAVLAIKDHWNTIRNDASKLIDDIVSYFASLPARVMNGVQVLIGDFLSFGEKLVSAILSAFTHIGSDIANAIKSSTSHIPIIGSALAHVGLAKGGYVTKPTFALVGEAGPEFVIPQALMESNFASGVSPLPSSISSGGGAMSGSPMMAGGHQINSTNTFNLYGTPQQMITQMQTLLDQNNKELARTLKAAR